MSRYNLFLLFLSHSLFFLTIIMSSVVWEANVGSCDALCKTIKVDTHVERTQTARHCLLARHVMRAYERAVLCSGTRDELVLAMESRNAELIQWSPSPWRLLDAKRKCSWVWDMTQDGNQLNRGKVFRVHIAFEFTVCGTPYGHVMFNV